MKNITKIITLVGLLLGVGIIYASLELEHNEKLDNVDLFEGVDAKLYRTPSCGCCELYEKDLMSHNFDVDAAVQNSLEDVRGQFGIPMDKMSCHITILDDYFVEGHVPFAAIKKLLEERPNIEGIALPGMPTGTPGMPGPKMGNYVVYAKTHSGEWEEFMVI